MDMKWMYSLRSFYFTIFLCVFTRCCRRALVLSGEVSIWPLPVLFWALLDSSHGLLPPDLPCKYSVVSHKLYFFLLCSQRGTLYNSYIVMQYSLTLSDVFCKRDSCYCSSKLTTIFICLISYFYTHGPSAGARQHVERLRYFYERALVDAPTPTDAGESGGSTAAVS